MPAPRPRHPNPKNAYSPRHARAMPAPVSCSPRDHLRGPRDHLRGPQGPPQGAPGTTSGGPRPPLRGHQGPPQGAPGTTSAQGPPQVAPGTTSGCPRDHLRGAQGPPQGAPGTTSGGSRDHLRGPQGPPQGAPGTTSGGSRDHLSGRGPAPLRLEDLSPVFPKMYSTWCRACSSSNRGGCEVQIIEGSENASCGSQARGAAPASEGPATRVRRTDPQGSQGETAADAGRTRTGHGPHDRIRRNGRGPDADRTRVAPFLPGGTGHVRAMPAPRPRHSCQIVAYSPRHARAMPAPRPRQCPVPPGPP
eukprot:gene19800-biopygen8508